MRRLLSALTLLLPLSAMAAAHPAPAADDVPDQRLPLRDADLVVSGTRAEVRSGTAVTLAWSLPAESSLRSVAGDRRGFAVAGTVRADGGRDLLLYVGDTSGTRRLPAPPGTARVRDWPVLLEGSQGLQGLAWLEGPNESSLAVRAARWSGERWQRIDTLAAGGNGSQLALTGARLADGSWLLAWSAFDGEDDEILWSRSRADGWTSPQRVAPENHVPDVTPSLAPFGNGALLAWSRYDGHDYRVVTARFDGARFQAPREAGPAGSVQPELAGGGDRAVLIYRTVLPAEWRAVALDAAGEGRRFGVARARGDERPALRLGLGVDGAELLWRAGAEPLLLRDLP